MERIRRIARLAVSVHPILTVVTGLLIMGPQLTAIVFLILWVIQDEKDTDKNDDTE